MNGNITKEGIRADLEWMHRVGIRGFQNFDAALMTPQIIEKRLTYMTPERKDAFKFTAQLADSLGLEMAIAGFPGWSESGDHLSLFFILLKLKNSLNILSDSSYPKFAASQSFTINIVWYNIDLSVNDKSLK
jgi:hypothetical protein